MALCLGASMCAYFLLDPARTPTFVRQYSGGRKAGYPAGSVPGVGPGRVTPNNDFGVPIIDRTGRQATGRNVQSPRGLIAHLNLTLRAACAQYRPAYRGYIGHLATGECSLCASFNTIFVSSHLNGQKLTYDANPADT